MATSIAYIIVYSMHCFLNAVANGGKELMKPSDYIALHLLNCVICAIVIGVLYNVYFG
jgi:amino acid transporter